MIIFTPFIMAFSFVYFCGDAFIQWMKQYRQPIRLNGPQNHIITKKGTPTMGGLLIFMGLLMGCLISVWPWRNSYMTLFIFIFTSFGLIGWLDDILKLYRQSHRGLPGKIRLLSEGTIATIAIIYGCHIGILSTTILIPFLGKIALGLFYIPFAAFIVVGSANAVNLTDGLDALATSVSLVAVCALSLIHLWHPIDYGLLISLGALAGALFGFLKFNRYPARLFMGDVGSLAIGASLGMVSLMLKQEFIWAVIGGVFVVEVVSVILQVASFRLRAKRIFLMAPLHHHFEKLGFPEKTITFYFTIAAILFATIGLGISFFSQ